MPLSEIHVRSEHSAGRVAVVENTLPATHGCLIRTPS